MLQFDATHCSPGHSTPFLRMAASGTTDPLGHASPETTQRYYLAAEQLDLPREVELICRRMQEALTSTTTPSVSSHSPLGWYERRGYIKERGC